MATSIKFKSIMLSATIVVLIFGPASVMASSLCIAQDNGTGTITLPPMGCEYSSPNDVFRIINGLQTGTTIEMAGTLMDFACCDPNCSLCSLPLDPNECETPGGTLGGHGNCFTATLYLDVSGTGALTGFNRYLGVPVFGEVHTGPRNPGDPVQNFATDLFRFSGELFGDPDFCVIRVTGGTDFGLPSPGHTTLIELPGGDFMVDSFFDINYQIEFQGCPGVVNWNPTKGAQPLATSGSKPASSIVYQSLTAQPVNL